MKLAQCVSVLFAASSACAFNPIATMRSRQAIHVMQLAVSADEDAEKLEAMSKTWDELRKKEKEVGRSHDEGAAMDLLQNILETAIEYTRIREHVEEEHAHSAHEALETAQKLEDDLKSIMNEAHHDADYADAVVGNYKVIGAPEDIEERRELAVSELSHHIENYAEERLHEAHLAELKAKDEEDEAKRSLNMLAEKEEELKATLEELKVFKSQKESDRKGFYNEFG